MNILLVDDDVETRTLYAEFLRAADFDVREAEDGLAGLEMVNKERPDFIISGIVMPRMDGYGFVSELQKNVVTSQIPVIFLSHLGREEDRKRAAEMGVKDFIVRDMTSPKEVISRVKSLFSGADYLLHIVPGSMDADRLARDFHLDSSLMCPEKTGSQVTLKLRLRDKDTKTFDAELTCL